MVGWGGTHRKLLSWVEVRVLAPVKFLGSAETTRPVEETTAGATIGAMIGALIAVMTEGTPHMTGLPTIGAMAAVATEVTLVVATATGAVMTVVMTVLQTGVAATAGAFCYLCLLRAILKG